jgi:hypothetical protein
VKGLGNSLDFGSRIYDSRIGRWLSVDPLQNNYPFLTPNNFVANNPIIFIDPDGKRIILSGNDKAEFVAKLSLLTGYKLELQQDGNLKIIGESSKPISESLKMAVFNLLDENGTKYKNDVVFKLVTNSKEFDNKRYGKITGDRVFFDSYETGAFDMDDFRTIKDNAAYAAFLGHIIGERSYVENYKKVIEEKENVKDYDKKTKTLMIEGSDDLFMNAHMAGQILETKVLSEFVETPDGRPVKLNPPGNLVSYGDIKANNGKATFNYGPVSVEVKTSSTDSDVVESAETKVINHSIKLKI